MARDDGGMICWEVTHGGLAASGAGRSGGSDKIDYQVCLLECLGWHRCHRGSGLFWRPGDDMGVAAELRLLMSCNGGLQSRVMTVVPMLMAFLHTGGSMMHVSKRGLYKCGTYIATAGCCRLHTDQ